MGSTLNLMKYGQARNLITNEISLLRRSINSIDDAIRCNNLGKDKLEKAAISEADRYMKQAHRVGKDIKIIDK